MPNPGDLKWALKTLSARAAANTLPIQAHLRLAAIRGRFQCKFKGIPSHVRTNLAAVFDDPERIDAIARQHVEFLGRSYLKGVLPHLKGSDDPDRWPVEGLEHLDAALKEGKGAFLATAHLGHARMIGPVLRAHGYDVRRIVAKSLTQVARDSRWNEWLDDQGLVKNRVAPWIRSLIRTDDIPAQLDIRPILKALANNKPIMVAGDGLRAAEFAMLSFLGKRHPFATGFVKIAVMMGTPILPSFALEDDGDLQIRIRIDPTLELSPHALIDDNLMKFVEVLDRQVRSTPHLWHRWSVKNTFEKAERWAEAETEDRWNQTFRNWS